MICGPVQGVAALQQRIIASISGRIIADLINRRKSWSEFVDQAECSVARFVMFNPVRAEGRDRTRHLAPLPSITTSTVRSKMNRSTIIE
jgi:hypothetical protein